MRSLLILSLIKLIFFPAMVKSQELTLSFEPVRNAMTSLLGRTTSSKESPAPKTDQELLKEIEQKLLGINVNTKELPKLFYTKALLLSNFIRSEALNIERITEVLSAVNDYLAQEARWSWEFEGCPDDDLPNWSIYKSDLLLIKKFALQVLSKKYEMRIEFLNRRGKPEGSKYYKNLISSIANQDLSRPVFAETIFDERGSNTIKSVFELEFKPSYFSSEISIKFFSLCYFVNKIKLQKGTEERLSREKIESTKMLLQQYTSYPHLIAFEIMFPPNQPK